MNKVNLNQFITTTIYQTLIQISHQNYVYEV